MLSLETSVDVLELSVRSANLLQQGQVKTVRELCALSADTLKLKYFARDKDVKDIVNELARHGLALHQPLEGGPLDLTEALRQVERNMKKLLTSGLTRDAVLTLLSADTKLSKSTINQVLAAAANLSHWTERAA